jgi:ATP-dependent DNA helicase DinG
MDKDKLKELRNMQKESPLVPMYGVAVKPMDAPIITIATGEEEYVEHTPGEVVSEISMTRTVMLKEEVWNEPEPEYDMLPADNEESSLPTPDYENLLSYAPFELRDHQVYALDEIKKGLLDDNIRFVIVEAPTGSGKSVLTMTTAQAAKCAYVTTANKALQDQYVRDFADYMVNLKGRANYRCYKHDGHNCADSPCKADRKKLCTKKCEYHEQIALAKDADVTTMNIAAYLAFMNFANFQERNLAVCDEGHSLAQWLTNFIEITFSEEQFARYGITGIMIPDYEDISFYERFLYQVHEYLVENQKSFSKSDKYDAEDYARFQKKVFEFLESVKENDLSNWVVAKEKNLQGVLHKLAFKPVAVSQFAQDYLFAHTKKTVILSATILDFATFATSLGMKPEETKCVRVPSTFPKERRPIYTSMASTRLSQKNLDENIPDLAAKCRQILEHYPDQKGIIHGTSYAICKKLNNLIRSPRVLFPESSRQQKETLEQHERSKNTVLLSPSMTEGIDLKDDHSRFQIIVKVPFPYLGDPVVKKRMEIYPNYYGLQTILTLVQAYGRSVRSKEDWAHTYVLDAQFHRVMQEQRRWLPEWFLEAIQ